MKKKIYLAVAAVVIVVAVILIATMGSKKAPTHPTSELGTLSQQADVKPIASPGNGSMQTLNDIMAKGKPQKCAVTYTDNNTQNQATVYLNGSNVRMDTTYTLNGAVNKFSMISDGKIAYLWTNDSTIGVKVAAKQNSTSTQSSLGTKLRQDLDPNHQYQYDCSDWTVDTSEFTPPSSINFKDMTNPQSSIPNPVGSKGSTVNKAQACAACNYAGSGKAQCLASLGCN